MPECHLQCEGLYVAQGHKLESVPAAVSLALEETMMKYIM